MQVDERKIRRISMEKEDIDIVQIKYTHIWFKGGVDRFDLRLKMCVGR